MVSIPIDELISRNWQNIAKIATFAKIVNRGALSPNLPFLSSRAFLDISEPSSTFGSKIRIFDKWNVFCSLGHTITHQKSTRLNRLNNKVHDCIDRMAAIIWKL